MGFGHAGRLILCSHSTSPVRLVLLCSSMGCECGALKIRLSDGALLVVALFIVDLNRRSVAVSLTPMSEALAAQSPRIVQRGVGI